jgi:hypothetical protein
MKDRRTIKDRRRAERKAAGDPDRRAAQVERIYHAVPVEQRQAAGLNYEHVRLVLNALHE